MKWLIGILVISILYTSYHWTQKQELKSGDLTKEGLESLIETYLQNNETIGMCVGIAMKDRILFNKCFGYSEVGKNERISASHIFSLASITKFITALCVVQLVEQNLISLDHPITRFFPELPGSFQPIKVRHLLNHTSGIESLTVLADSLKMNHDIDLRKDNRILQFLSEKHLIHKPGEHWSYNNSGYFLLGKIIEQVSGLSYQDFLYKYILVPAGMSNTGLCSQEPQKSSYQDHYLVNSHLTNYLKDQRIYEQLKGEGGICSTTEDLLKLMLAIENGLLVGTEYFLLMLEAAKLNDGGTIPYGFGVRLGSTLGPDKFGHTGGAISDKTILAHYPNENISLVVLSNSEPAEVDFLAYEIEKLLLPSAFDDIMQPVDAEFIYAGEYQWGEYSIRYQMDSDGRLWEIIQDEDGGDSLVYDYIGNHRFYNKLYAQELQFIFKDKKAEQVITYSGGLFSDTEIAFRK